jgi:hypothetical protein
LWELAPFFETAIVPASLDLAYGVITNFVPFKFMYLRLLGSSAEDWLPSLYLAASAVPNIDTVHRAKLIGGFIPNFLERDF